MEDSRCFNANLSNGVASKERKLWIDELRAIAVLLVILGHQIYGYEGFFTVTSPIKIPLFFVISGYVFRMRDGDAKVFFGKLLKTIIIPWFALGIIPVILTAPFNPISNLWTSLLNLLLGESVWYMPCCAIAEIIFFFAMKYIKKPLLFLPLSGILFAVGLFIPNESVFGLWMFNRALICQLFLLAGYCMREFEDKLYFSNIFVSCGCTVLFVALCVLSFILFPGKSLDVHLNDYYNLPICLGMIFSGCYSCFAWARRQKYVPKFLQFIGQNTLVFYILSSVLIYFPTKILSLVFHFSMESTDIFLAILKTIIGVVMCSIASWLIGRFAPWLTGRKPRKQ